MEAMDNLRTEVTERKQSFSTISSGEINIKEKTNIKFQKISNNNICIIYLKEYLRVIWV